MAMSKVGEEPRNWLHTAGVAAVSAIALVGAAEAGASPQSANHQSQSCKRYAQGTPRWDKYRACVAYTLDATGYQEFGVELSGGKIIYFALGRSPYPRDAQFGEDALESHYYGDARTDIEKQVAQWPEGVYSVDNYINVRSTFINKAGNLAIIQSVEDWVVQDVYRGIIYQEKLQPHVTTMCKVKAGDGDTWDVVANDSELDFDCEAFAAGFTSGHTQ